MKLDKKIIPFGESAENNKVAEGNTWNIKLICIFPSLLFSVNDL